MKRISIIFMWMLGMVSGQDTVQVDIACLDCHQSGTWFPLSDIPRFEHEKDTGYKLEYVHAELSCVQCHVGESIDAFHTFSVKGTDCVSCHQDVHQNYWGSQCETCHTPEDWNPGQAYRRHNETLFPLLAAHQSLECYLCHSSPGMIPSIECQDCHSSDFIPDLGSHSGLNDRADCSTCHAPTRWNQILAINHGVFFPIYSGEHQGKWNSCSTCHTQSGDFQTFTCLSSGCHSVSGMNSEHCEGNDCERCDGLTYPRTGVDSDDCYYCHPQGNTSKCGD